MSTDGYFRANGTIRDSHGFLNWQLAEQDISGNRSRINWQFRVRFNQADTQLDNGFVNSNVGQLWANGGRVRSYGGNIATRDVEITSGSFWVSHRSDGVGEVQFGIGISFYGSGRSEATSAVWSLPQIPRQSNPSFSKPLYTLGERIIINTNRKADFQHKGNLQIPKGAEIMNFRNQPDAWGWTPNEIEIDEIYRRSPNTARAKIKTEITTWNGETQIGGVGAAEAEIQFEASKIAPDFTNFTFEDANQKIAAITGNNQIFVQGFSKPRFVISPANQMRAKKFATPAKYIFSADGKQITQNFARGEIRATFEEAVNSSGSLNLTATATDSRGISTSVSKNVEVLPYSAPSLSVQAKRQNNFDETVEIEISGEISPLKIGRIAKNAVLSLKLRHRQKNGTWSGYKTLTAQLSNDSSFSASKQFLNLNRAESFEIEVEVSDKLSTASATAEISAGKPIFFISNNKEKVGVNKVPEFGDLDVAGDIYSRGVKVPLEAGESPKKSWQENQNIYTNVPMGWGTRGVFYKVNGIVYWWMYSIANYGNGEMVERIPERYLPRHAQTFTGVCINNDRHAGGFAMILEPNGKISKRGTTGHNEYHICGSYLARNWD